MLDYLRQQNASLRKLRLFSCARCRLFWHLLTDERSRTAVEVGEQYADGRATVEVLRAASAGAWGAAELGPNAQTPSAWVAVGVASECDPPGESFWDVAWDFYNGSSPMEVAAMDAAAEAEVALLRDIFTNPFRPPQCDPGWRTSTVLALAGSIYDDRAFDCLPILADALEDAGCGDAEILDHLRGPGPHVRGCWALDLVLGAK
jgi:hypothetical protein